MPAPRLRQRALRIFRGLGKIVPNAALALTYKTNWQLLVAVMLSAQTTDKKVNEVTPKLFARYRTVRDYARASPGALARDIREIGLYRTKARNIVATARSIESTHGGRIPATMEELVALPGIGRKTANIVLQHAYHTVEGIAVDTHVRRLARLFGFTTHTDPVKIERDLMELFPRRAWKDLAHRLIAYGRAYCSARCRHTTCPLRSYTR